MGVVRQKNALPSNPLVRIRAPHFKPRNHRNQRAKPEMHARFAEVQPAPTQNLTKILQISAQNSPNFRANSPNFRANFSKFERQMWSFVLARWSFEHAAWSFEPTERSFEPTARSFEAGEPSFGVRYSKLRQSSSRNVCLTSTTAPSFVTARAMRALA